MPEKLNQEVCCTRQQRILESNFGCWLSDVNIRLIYLGDGGRNKVHHVIGVGFLFPTSTLPQAQPQPISFSSSYGLSSKATANKNCICVCTWFFVQWPLALQFWHAYRLIDSSPNIQYGTQSWLSWATLTQSESVVPAFPFPECPPSAVEDFRAPKSRPEANASAIDEHSGNPNHGLILRWTLYLFLVYRCLLALYRLFFLTLAENHNEQYVVSWRLYVQASLAMLVKALYAQCIEYINRLQYEQLSLPPPIERWNVLRWHIPCCSIAMLPAQTTSQK